jgi:SAM-dependent methyltransferase
MTERESYVVDRFATLAGRFKVEVPPEDVRLAALRRALGPVEGKLLLDLGCGKGRFGRRLAEQGACVVGLDPCAAMLNHAGGIGRVLATAGRIPLADSAVDGVFAVEVLEHIESLDEFMSEALRVLRPGGVLAIVDKNAASLNVARPWLPNVAVKWVDEHRGRWMYPAGGPVRERWFHAGALCRVMRQRFERVTVEYLLSPDEAERRLFRCVPQARLFVLWSARRALAHGVGAAGD